MSERVAAADAQVVRRAARRESMRLRTFYGLVTLWPLAGLGLAAALSNDASAVTVGLGPGGRAHWLYPRSAVRGLLAYGVVACWLLGALYRRPPGAFESLLWRAPLAYAAANVAVLAPWVLIHGQASQFLSEQGGQVLLRLLIHLLVGFGYVELVVFARKQLWPSGALEAPQWAGAGTGAGSRSAGTP